VKLSILTSVDEKGIIKRNRNLVLEAIQSYSGKALLITFEKPKKKRSNPQNSFLWGVVYQIVQHGLLEATGELRSIENIHYCICLKMFAPEREIINTDTGESFFEKLTSSEFTTSQMMDYIAEIQKWSSEFLGLTIPDPNSEITLNFNE